MLYYQMQYDHLSNQMTLIRSLKQSKDILPINDVGGEHDPNIQVKQKLKNINSSHHVINL